MVPNPTTGYLDTLRRHNENHRIKSSLSSRPSMRSRSSLSVNELKELTQKMNLTTSGQKPVPKKIPFGRSYSAPMELQPNALRRPNRYGSYSDGSSSGSSSGSSMTYVDLLPTAGKVAIAPASRYHTSRMPLRRVTFNERVEVFELSSPNALLADKQYKIRAIKNDIVKFHDQKPVRRPTSRVQRRMTSYIKDKLKNV